MDPRALPGDGDASQAQAALPLVSVIVPVHNGEAYLEQALESIRDQDYRPLEVIVIDDGSTDGTASIARRFSEDLHYLYQPRAGPAAARNAGLRLARGEWIAFLDADDLWPPGKLVQQAAYLRDDPGLQVVLGRVQQIEDAIPRAAGSALTPGYREIGDPLTSFVVGSALVRRAAFERIGRFDAGLSFSEDVDWFMKARELDVPLLAVGEIALLYRRHVQAMTHGKDAVGLGLARALKRSLDRRRSAAAGRAAADGGVALPDGPMAAPLPPVPRNREPAAGSEIRW